jgi:hypothetical protein
MKFQASRSDFSHSWEPHENVKECDRLLKSFWDHIGVDNNDYPLGYEVQAKPKWISAAASNFPMLYHSF